MNVCKCCAKELPANSKSNRRFCDTECARQFAKALWREKNPKSELGILATNTRAEVNEMRVAIDLLAKGFEVYRAAFQGMPCDMLVVPPGHQYFQLPGEAKRPRRVEVTTGNYSPNGEVAHPKRNTANFDVLAVVLSDRIIYKPEL